MEVRLDAAEGFSALEQDCFVTVRVGEVKKHGRFAPSRSYQFPGGADTGTPTNGRIEIFRRIGTVPLNFMPGEIQDVSVPSLEPGGSNFQFKVTVNDAIGNAAPEIQLRRPKVEKAKAYLDEHRIEDFLRDAMREVLREQPSDPTKFLAEEVPRLASMPQKLKAEVTKAKLMDTLVNDSAVLPEVPPGAPAVTEEAMDAEALLEAANNLLGSLDVKAATAAPEEEAAEDIRERTRAALEAAAGSGALLDALAAEAARSKAEEPPATVPLKDIRAQLKARLSTGSRDGSLENVLRQSMEITEVPPAVKEVRGALKAMLTESMLDEQEPCRSDLPEPTNLATTEVLPTVKEVRGALKAMLTEGSFSGTLENALRESNLQFC